MPHDFDDTLKKLVNANKEDFVRFVMPDQEVEIVDTLETEFKRTIIADSMIQIRVSSIPAGVHFEFQARYEEEVAEEIMTDLGATGKDEALLTAYVLIGLVFDKKTAEDRQWLRRRWHAMSERLKDNWFYQEITEEAREEAREEDRKQELERWRQTMQSLVQRRFADQKMALLAEGQAAIITDLNVLQDLILKLAVASSEEEAQDYLLSWRKAS